MVNFLFIHITSAKGDDEFGEVDYKGKLFNEL